MEVHDNMKAILKVCNWLGLFPKYDKSSSSFKRSKVYSFFVLVFVSSLQVYSLFEKVQRKIRTRQDSRIIDIVLLTEIGFAAATVYVLIEQFVWDLKDVNNVFVSFKFVDKSLQTLHLAKPKKLNWLALKCLVLNTLLAFTCQQEDRIQTAGKILQVYCILNLALLQGTIMECIVLRMRQMNDILETFQRNGVKAVDKQSDEQVKSLIKMHGVICEAISVFGDLFGWHLLLQIVLPTVHVMSLTDQPLLLSHVLYMGQAIWLATKGHKVKQQLQNFERKSDLLLYRRMDSEVMYKSLVLLSVQTKLKRPAISAAGFFNIDRSTIFIFGILILFYFIMFAQFWPKLE